jgi:hypothetical protein
VLSALFNLLFVIYPGPPLIEAATVAARSLF